MGTLQKKIVSVIIVAGLLILTAANVQNASVSDNGNENQETVVTENGQGEAGETAVGETGQREAGAGETAVSEAGQKKAAAEQTGAENPLLADKAYQQADTDLIFWYSDKSYDAFFSLAAEEYFKETGTKVLPMYEDAAEYMTEVYDRTMQDDAYPDVYLISGDNLEAAYLYGLAAVNEKAESYAGAAEHALEAAAYGDKLLGYPLNYNTCLFVYQNSYFETAPVSMQEIIDYSNENEPGENVEYLVEWDVNDPFYDFPFVANSVTFEKDEPQRMNVVYDEEMYQQDLEFFETLLSSFSVNAETVSEEHILENFKEGRTLCAMLDTDSLYQLEGYNYSVTQIPDLNEELKSAVCAMTEMLVVNDFSEKTEQAADFAEFATVALADKLYETSGHYSVFLSEQADMVEQTAYETYETAVLAPDSQDARDFWVGLKETIAKYF